MQAYDSPGEQLPCPHFNTIKSETKSPELAIQKLLLSFWFPNFQGVVDIILTQAGLDYLQGGSASTDLYPKPFHWYQDASFASD